MAFSVLASLKFEKPRFSLKAFDLKRFFTRHHIIFYTELAVLAAFGLVLTTFVEASVNNTIVQPKLIATTPNNGTLAADIASPISIKFDHPIKQSDLKADINPPAPGAWGFQTGVLGDSLSNELIFNPSQTLKLATTYTVSLSNIHSNAGIDAPYSYSFSFKTISAPKVIASLPADNSSDLNVNGSIVLKLNIPNNYAANFAFSFTPAVPFTANLNSDKTAYVLKPTSSLKHGTTYELKVEKSEIFYDLINEKLLTEGPRVLDNTLHLTTLAAPTIASVSASGDSAAREPITINFSKEMLRQSVQDNLKTTTLKDYSLSWNDNKTLVITPKEQLAYNTTYTITFGAGTLALDGSFFETDYTHSFTTIGNVKVGQFYPTNGATGINIASKILVYFNQEVDKNSAQNHFSISPNVSGNFSWDGNTLKFSPLSNLTYNQSYTVNIRAGVKSITALDSVNNFASTFRTGDLYEVVKLAVPAFKQKYSLSCEFANMRMVLSYRGVSKSEDDLIAETPIDNTPHVGETWGDPYTGFVGNVNGTYFADGYGAYYPVIQGEVSKYRPAESHTGWDLPLLLKEVKAGNPVIIWSCLICNGPRYWNTPAGKQIYAYEFYHMLTVVGYTGNPENPVSIIVNDSVYGRQLSWTKSQFLSKWSTMNNTAVVVK